MKYLPPSFPFVLAAILSFLLLPAHDALRAQGWRTETVPEVGMQFEVPSRLERLPMKIGAAAIHRRARLRPNDINDYIRAQYEWTCDVYEFSKKDAKPGEVELPDGVPDELREQLKRIMATAGNRQHKSFREWLEAQKDIEILEEADKERGRGSKPDYEHWVYVQKTPRFGPVELNYCEASVYDFEDRQVAIVVEMPLENDRPLKPKTKWRTIIKKIMRSGELYEVDEDDDPMAFDAKKDRYADTDAKKKALADAKQNIAGLKGWDYFTQPNYIVLYAWDFEDSDGRNDAKKQAEFYSGRLERMRELYLESYPLDETGTKAIMPDPSTIPTLGGPITGPRSTPEDADDEAGTDASGGDDEELGILPYPVFRLCATYDQFRKYGQSPPGVVGWFSPASKELVVFLGGDTMMGDGATEAVTYHEGWHQFADLYFHHPDSPKHATLHRWFDEGHGDYFGSFRWTGSRWKYFGSKMRYQDVKQMVQQEDYVPFKTIVSWPRRIFYGPKAPYYYAQAFSMIDFLRRGTDERDYQEHWGEILDMYRRVVLVTGDAEKAIEIAFRGFESDEQWKQLEDAWKDWVKSSDFLNGR